MRLRLRLCGSMAAEVAGTPVALPASERARALIAWLALHPGEHPRAVVAEQLWPDTSPEGARANLRTALWAVRKSCGEADLPLHATRTTLALGSASVDVLDEPSLTHGFEELLPGLDDEWVHLARAELGDRRARSLTTLADEAEAGGDLELAVQWSRRLVLLRPLDEAAHRALVERLLRTGERGAALVEAREFGERLRAEVGVRPSPATRAVHARARAGTGGQRRTAVFGRADEIGWLLNRWREASQGCGQVVVLEGEAGIGKTTLLTELTRRVTGLGGHAATTSGIDVAGETPFAAWLELARSMVSGVRQPPASATWAAELNRLADSLGARLGHAEPPPAATAPELERLRVFEALLRLVEWACAERPTLLAVDDAHLADRASLRLTAYVGRRLPRLPALLVLVRREGPRRVELDSLLADLAGHGVTVTTRVVAPISDGEVAALARSLHPVESDLVDKVVSVAEGNPLLAVETIRTLVAGGGGPPPNLRAAVRATLGRLPEATTAVVELLAAAGRPLTSAELRRLGVPVSSGVVASSEGLLTRRDGRVGFRHELLRAATYSGLTDPEGFHDRLADGIDPADHVERAHHLAAAGRTRESAHALAAGAAQARDVGALDEATELLRRAVENDPDDGALWLELEEMYALTDRRPELEAAWDEALARLPRQAWAEAWCRRGRQFRTVVCHPEESLRSYRTARSLASQGTAPDVLADALIGMAWGETVAGSAAEGERLLAEASGLVELEPRLRADALEIRMQGLLRRARFREAADLVADSHDPVVQIVEGLPRHAYAVLVHAACALVCVGEDEGALAVVDRALTATTAVTGLAVKTLSARAQILARLGRHDEAARAVLRVQEWSERLDDPVIAATATHDRGLLALLAGRHAEAADLLGRALASGAAVSRVGAGLARAEALARAGDPDSASAQLRSALLEPVGRSDQAWALVPRVAFVQALIACARGDTVEARARFEECASAWQRVLESYDDEAGEGYVASLVDLGRPPIVGLVEPAREMDRVSRLLARLGPSPIQAAPSPTVS